MIAALRRRLASRRLQRIVDRTRGSYEVRRYRERRAAAKLGWKRRQEAAQ